jgi:hypothetical protein
VTRPPRLRRRVGYLGARVTGTTIRSSPKEAVDAASAPTEPDVGPRASTVPEGTSSAGPDEPTLPETVGRFEVLSKLGEGGMGIVLEAYDPRLDRRIALKLVRASTSSARARLVREAQAMARVAHPNVVSVFEAGVFEDEVFVAMELVPGATTLGEWLVAQQRGWREIATMFVAAGRGLAAVHEAGIVHRDFKLDNVLVGADGRARVVDFGIARGRRDDAAPGVAAEKSAAAAKAAPAPRRLKPLDMQLTRPDTVLGTPSYMSPEQFRGADVGVASDQFSFAVAAYRGLYGTAPFQGETLEDLRDAVTTGKLEPPPASAAPPEVQGAIVRALRVDPAERWPTFVDLVDELEAALAHDPDSDLAVGRNARRLVPGILLVLAGVAFGGLTAAGKLQTLDLWRIFVFAAIATCAMAAVFFGFRRQLMATRTNRRVAAMFLIVGASVTLHRALGLHAGMQPHAVLMGDALLAAALFGFGALSIERWFGIIAAIAAIAAVVCSFGMRPALVAFPIALLCITAVPVFLWRREPPRVVAGASSRSRSGSGSTPGTPRPAKTP